MTPVAPDDASALATIHADAFDAAWNADEIAAMISGPGAFGFKHEAAGFILCRVIADEAEVLTIAVSPAHRRRAVATALLTGALAWAEVHGARSMFLEVAEDNHPALALYGAFGFVDVGRRPAYYVRDNHAVGARVMRRDLNR